MIRPIAALAACLMAFPLFAENRIDRIRPDAPVLAAYGSFDIGVRTLEMVNPDQIDIVSIDPDTTDPENLPRYDRPLTIELWYPAVDGSEGETSLRAYLRDGRTEVTLTGRAVRDAQPAPTSAPYPLVILSHGYPGNRFLMSPLAENLASKGYVVASIDHTDSTYRTRDAFGSTLVNRPLDTLFVLDEVENISNQPGSSLHQLVDTSNVAVIGYSMGGYGAIILAGGGVTQIGIDHDWGAPLGTLAIHQSGSETHEALIDPRIKTAIAFGPWGLTRDFWDEETLKGVRIPMLFIAGSVDDVSGYETGVRAIWDAATGADRALLTFDNANHNAGAPMPAPAEADIFDNDLGFNLTEHYSDPVWDTVRMNNISQHFVTAWLGVHLRGDPDMERYLTLTPLANDGIWSVGDDGTPSAEHTHWEGFPDRTAKGLRFEVLMQGDSTQ